MKEYNWKITEINDKLQYDWYEYFVTGFKDGIEYQGFTQCNPLYPQITDVYDIARLGTMANY